MKDEHNGGGGPAYPVWGDAGDHIAEGMALRDYFAAKALPVVAAGCHYMGEDFLRPDKYASAALDAYRMADALLKARAA